MRVNRRWTCVLLLAGTPASAQPVAGEAPDARPPALAGAPAAVPKPPATTPPTEAASAPTAVPKPPATTPPTEAASAPIAAAAPVEAPAVTEKARESDRVPPDRRAPSRLGLLGLDEVVSADPGPAGTYRLRLSGFHSTADDFPEAGGENAFSGAQVAIAATPLPFLELALGVRNTSNSNAASFPELLQTQGDLDVAVKGGHFVTEIVGLGAAATVRVTSGLGGSAYGDASASVHFQGLATFDMARAERAPVRVHVNLGYFLENSSDVGASRDGSLDLVQEWGLQVAEYDRITFGLGIEAPVAPALAPYVEYRLDVPLEVSVVRGAIDAREYSFAAFPHAVTPGLRVFPLPALAIDAGVRIGLSSEAYPGVPATPPWLALLGFSYTLDPRPEVIEREIVRAAPPTPPAPVAADGAVKGRVLDARTGEPVRGVHVEYVTGGRNAQLADDAGRFTSYRLPPGKIGLRLVAEGYEPRTIDTVIEAGKDAAVEVRLEPGVRATGRLAVRLVDERGRARAGRVNVGGKAAQSGEAAKDRPFEVDLPVGRYPVSASAEGLAAETQDVEIKAGETTTVRVALKRGGRPADKATLASAPVAASTAGDGGASVRGDRIRTKAPIRFDGAALTAASKAALDGVAAFLKAHPEITKVRIEAHTAAGEDRAALVRESEEQARSVQSHLVTRGVAPGRLATRGRGPDQPVAPNLTERGREKNRRVELVIVERQ